jgi:hypothetical protein
MVSHLLNMVGRLLTDRAMVFVLAGSCVCVTCCSSMAGSTYGGMTKEYGISRLVATLTISVRLVIASAVMTRLTGKALCGWSRCWTQ